MSGLRDLVDKQYELNKFKQSLDMNAPLQSREGRLYVRTLVQLVKTSMLIEERQKKLRQRN